MKARANARATTTDRVIAEWVNDRMFASSGCAIWKVLTAETGSIRAAKICHAGLRVLFKKLERRKAEWRSSGIVLHSDNFTSQKMPSFCNLSSFRKSKSVDETRGRQ